MKLKGPATARGFFSPVARAPGGGGACPRAAPFPRRRHRRDRVHPGWGGLSL